MKNLVNSGADHFQEVWRTLDIEFEDPFMNMAVEEAIARCVGKGVVPSTIRFWRNRNAVVVGEHQEIEAETNLHLCEKNHVDVVRRFTGGGAVFHDQKTLNFSISLQESHHLVKNDILETFRVLASGIVHGLKLLGLSNATWEERNSICIDGHKVSGIAGCVRWGTVFCHGSILVSSDVDKLDKMLTPTRDGSERYVKSTRKAVTTLSKEMQRIVSTLEVKAALKRGIRKTFGIGLVEGKLTRQEYDLANTLYRNKYATRTWNLTNP